MGNDDESSAAGTVVPAEYRPGPDGAESASQPPKRRRIALACSACRIRKSRVSTPSLVVRALHAIAN